MGRGLENDSKLSNQVREIITNPENLQQFEIKRGTKMVNFKDGKKRK